MTAWKRCALARLSWRLQRRAAVRTLAMHRANNLWATGQSVTRHTRRQLRREAHRDVPLAMAQESPEFP